MNSSPSSQKLYPINWFSELTNRQYKGCLKVSSQTTVWQLYLDGGKLIFATNSNEPFKRLERHLAPHLASVHRASLEQWKLQFATSSSSPGNADYQVICWYVQQNYLPVDRAALVIQEIAKEVIASLLVCQEGNYGLSELETLDNFPKFCTLDLLALARICQEPITASSKFSTASNASVRGSGVATPEPQISPSRSQTGANLLSRESPPRTPVPSPQGSSRVYTIACIDDNPSIVRVIRNYLDDERFSVLSIDDPVKALMQIVRNKPDLILLDVQMPKLDGYELCSMLRRHPLFKNLPIIMVTGNTGFIDRAKAKLVRASDYLTKPFTKSDLNEIVLKHLP